MSAQTQLRGQDERAMRSYAQNGEDLIVLATFGDFVGRFLDIGACDGKVNSNTLALVERGWSGVLVEPSPKAFTMLQEIHRNNPKLTLVHAAVNTAWHLRPFWETLLDLDELSVIGTDSLQYSTTESRKRDEWCVEARLGERPSFYIPTIPLSALFAFGGVDFLSIDTEGTSVELFQAFPFESVRPWVVCVEHDGLIEDCKARVEPFGYREITRNLENILFKLEAAR
jgi:FkbM family methyltransferase